MLIIQILASAHLLVKEINGSDSDGDVRQLASLEQFQLIREHLTNLLLAVLNAE
jgi:hypothetical protein